MRVKVNPWGFMRTLESPNVDCYTCESPLHKALHLEPIGEALDPVVSREVLISHAETVAALGIEMQFRGFLRGSPILVKRDTVWRQAELVVAGGQDEHRRGIGRDAIRLGSPLVLQVNWRGEVGT